MAREVDDWQSVHRRLKRVAKRRAALDREELELIREAIRIAIWRHVGMTSIREYLEHECGYGPHVASERVRVAEVLDAMPALEQALGDGELSYSAVRAISRVATNRTEGDWIAACRGKNQREIEELLAEREVGDRPGAPRKPELRAKDRTYRGITPATEAALESARRELQEELGERLDDNQLLALLASRARNGGAPRARAAAQVAVTVCPSCQIGRQLAGNRQVALRPEELARLFCDAQWIDVNGKERSVQDVTPALRAKVMLRDHGKCRVPGCRAAANIEVHHIVPREQGGAHTLENLIALCDGHHVALHRGDITIDGPAESAVITNRAAAIVHVDNRSDQPSNEPADEGAAVHVDDRSRADAVLALTTLGFTKGEARRAVDEGGPVRSAPGSSTRAGRRRTRRSAGRRTGRRSGRRRRPSSRTRCGPCP
ncbi:MAG TPA: HNH endonuclease [Kofleriaceae bacterium]|nr:HNH endonuclease [Kofleriaceae bacterium]